VKKLLMRYPWYGNIRELKNVVNRAVLLADLELITIEQIPEEIRNYSISQDYQVAGIEKETPVLELKEAAIEAEKEVIIHALISSNYNKSKAARMLKIDRKTLYNKIKQFNIQFDIKET